MPVAAPFDVYGLTDQQIQYSYVRPLFDQLLAELEADVTIKFNVDLSVGLIESWFKDPNNWDGNKSRLRALVEKGQVEFVKPVWSQSVDC